MSKLWHVGVGILLGCICTVLVLWTAGFFHGRSAIQQPLISALGSVRPTDGRIGGQLNYAPYPTSVDRHSRAWKRFQERIKSGRVEAVRDLAVSSLVNRGLDAAITGIERGTQGEPEDALVLSDLSALYDERAHIKNAPIDYVSALDLVEHAIAISPDLPEARFNKAIVLEHLSLREEACAAWQKYLEIDSDSRWSEEARARLKDLTALMRVPRANPYELLSQEIEKGGGAALTRLAEEEPEVTREILEENIVPRWAEAMKRNEPHKVDQRTFAARLIAEVFAKRGRDRIFRDVVAEMEEAVRDPRSAKSLMLVQSLCRYRSGLERVSERTLGNTAMPDFAAAERGLRSIHSYAALFVRFQEARSQFFRRSLAPARLMLETLDKDPRIIMYPSLAARIHRLLSFIAGGEGDPTRALAEARRALDISSRLGEPQSIVISQNMIAAILTSLGRLDESWRHRFAALSWAPSPPVGQRQLGAMLDIFDGATISSLEQRRPRAALVFKSRSLALAESTDDSEEIISSSLEKARIEAALGRKAEAGTEFGKAVRALEKTNHLAGQYFAPLFDVTRREIDESENRAAAIALELRMAGSLGARADFDFRRGDARAAKMDLERALHDLEQRRAKVSSFSERVSFLDQAQSLYERMAALQLHLGRPEEALETLERFRSRTLLEQISKAPDDHPISTGAAGLGWREICRRLPSGTDVIFFASVEGRLISWLLRPSGVLIAARQPSWESVSSVVNALGESRSNPIVFEKNLEHLYRELMGPWRNDLLPGDRVILVPTQILFSVPFAALRDPVNQHFLVEDHAVGISPSISGFLAAVRRDQMLLGRPLATALLVGDPDTRSRTHESEYLPGSLPAAAMEIRQLSEIYQGIKVWPLTRDKATPRRALALLRESDIAHFAAHSTADFNDPANSRLILSSEGSDPGDLFAHAILRIHLNRTRVVVLATCSSQAGPVSPSEGSLSLAYSFLAAGVPAVVGSLWHIDDASTARFSLRLHRELRRGVDVISALRNAQLEEIKERRRNPDWTWASFQVLGGVVARMP